MPPFRKLHGEQAVTTLSQVVCPPFERGIRWSKVRSSPVAAILALEAVAEEHVEPGEGRVPRRLHIGLERHHRGQRHREGGAVHHRLVFGDDVHPLEEDRLDGVLPRPQRQRIVAERPVVGIEDERRIGPRSDMDVHGHSRINALNRANPLRRRIL